MNYSVLLGLALVGLVAACSTTSPAKHEALSEQPAKNVNHTTGNGSSPWAALNSPGNLLAKRSVHFDYDQYSIRDDYKALIEAHGAFLKQAPLAKVLVQGNTDERGSSEYNLALGQKRAEAVKEYLVTHGALETQIEAVSLGEEKPVNPGHDEAAWSENRRADMLYRSKDQ